MRVIHISSKIKEAIIWCRTVIPLEKRNVFVVYFLILCGTCIDNANTATLFTLQGDIQRSFNTDSSTASWVVSSYALTLGSFVMLSGKVADVIGPHNLYLIGLCVIWVCALICACLPTSSVITLIVFRALQGIGGSAMVPSTLALAANYFTGDKAKYLSAAVVCFIVALTGIYGVALILGGAFSLTSLGYKSYFWFVFAYALVINIVLVFLIIPINKTQEHKDMKLKNIDFIGGFLAVIGCLLIILGLIDGGENWKLPKAYVPLIVGVFTVISSVAFENLYIKRYQKKHQNRDKSTDWRLAMTLLYPSELIHIPNFLSILVVISMYYCTFTVVIAVGILYYTNVEGGSPLIVALKVFPQSVGLILGAILYRRSFYYKVGVKKMFILSAIFTLAATIWFSRTDYHKTNSYWKYGIIALFLYGFGVNIFFNIYIDVVVSNTPLHLQGVVNGLYQTCSQVLLSIGNALVPSIVGNVEVATTDEMKQHIQNRFKTVTYVLMGFHVVILIILILFVKTDVKKQKEPSSDEEEPASIIDQCESSENKSIELDLKK